MSDTNEQVFIAAATGNLEKLQAALAAGGDPGAPSADGRTPLVMAARAGHVDSIRALVAAGADPGAAAGVFGTPLGHAASEGHIDAVRALVELGAPLDPRSPEESAPLVSAVEMDDPDLVRYLVSAGASIEQTNRYGQTALIVCAIQGKARASAVLLELGASRDARDRVMSQTALEHATERGQDRLVALLSGEAVTEAPADPDEAPPAAVEQDRRLAPAEPAASAAPEAPVVPETPPAARPRVGPPSIVFSTSETGAAPEGTAAEIAAALEQPDGPQRTKRLYDLGVKAFREAEGDKARLDASVWMARALHAAAEAGDAQGWVEVGRCLFNGWGVAADPLAAIQAYGHAADLGSDEGAYAAAFNLYWAFQRDAEAHAYVQQAMAGRDPSGEAHYLAGLMAYNGRGRGKDDAEAVRLHTEAARRGNADALFELHIFHAKGVGCAIDEGRAAECLRTAAEKEHPRACYNMGAFLATGTGGFEKDEVQAAEWYRRGSAAGHGKAAATLAVMHMTGQGAPFYPARGRALLKRATELGFDGPGMAAAVGVDEAALDTAEEWFDLARAAIEGDDLDTLVTLLGDGPPVDMVSRRATTLLSTAAREGKAEAAVVLVGAGASPNGVPLPQLVGPDGSPLVLALKQGHFDVAERLLMLGADVNANVPYHGGSLNSFTKNEQVEAARWLLDHGADPERRSSDRCTPLMTAAREGQEAIVRVLLEHGADANAFKPVDFGIGVVTKDSALAMATYYKHKSIVKALKAAGATE